jgi:hypothetical protein
MRKTRSHEKDDERVGNAGDVLDSRNAQVDIKSGGGPERKQACKEIEEAERNEGQKRLRNGGYRSPG